MPSFCAYRNCHNLASFNWNGYCNEYHSIRAKILELKEQLEKLEEKAKKLQQETKQEKEEDKTK